jgi:signal transduction histidine kinase
VAAGRVSAETGEAATPDGIGPLLRELGGMLIERPGARGAPGAKTGVSFDRTAKVAGLQALLLPIFTAPLLLIVEPTKYVGDLGWFIAVALFASVMAIGAVFIRHQVSGAALAFSNAYTAAILALLTAITGGFSSPYPLLYPILASSIAPHRPRIRRVLIFWILVALCAPFLYENDVSARDAAEFVMIGAASVATLLTMVWLSSRVSASEVGLMDAVSSAREAQEQLAAEAASLIEMGEERDRLLARVSHELRTPLTSVKGYVEALVEGEGGELDPRQKELASVALRNAVRLELLIADLLLLSRVEAGQLELRPGRVQVKAALDRVREDLEQLAQETGVILIVEAPEDLEWTADRVRLDQAVANLISNAIKYSPDGAPVLVRARQVDAELWIEVIDKGVGIPLDEIERIGERFFRASTAGHTSGTGLGIAITRELIELHDGVLEIESEVGAGSIFRIRIPAGAESVA